MLQEVLLTQLLFLSYKSKQTMNALPCHMGYLIVYIKDSLLDLFINLLGRIDKCLKQKETIFYPCD